MKKTMKIAMGVMATAVVLGGLRWYKTHQTASADVEETAEVEKFSPVGPRLMPTVPMRLRPHNVLLAHAI